MSAGKGCYSPAYPIPAFIGRVAILLAVTSWMLFAFDIAHAENDPITDSEIQLDTPAQETGIIYQGQLRGIGDSELLEKLESNSQVMTLVNRQPPGLVALERRARNDIERLQKVLRSEAYYDSGIQYRIETDKTPVAVLLDIDVGDRYLLGQYTITYSGSGSEDADLPREPGSIGGSLGVPARAEMVIDLRQRLMKTLANIGYPLAQVADHSVTVDHADNSMSVEIDVVPGQLASFGSLEIVGATSVEHDYIKSFIPWQEGDIFERAKLNQARQRLLGTGLFAAVAFERPNQVDADGKLFITIRVEERKHRSIGFAGSWSTDEGFAVEAEWEHRNILGREESLSLIAEIGEIKQEFSAVFKKPHYRQQNQDFLANGALAHEDTDAFKGPLTRYFAGLQRRVSEHWSLVAGVPIEFSNLSDLQGSRNFSLYGLEFRGYRDTSTDRFDPQGGSRLSLLLRPYGGTGEERVNFVTGQLGLAGYHAIDKEDRYTLAARTRIGSVVGESTESLPANKRFYAGGGSSIRGYRYQSVGPLGPGNTPLGGRSLFELSAELRYKISDTLGGAFFIDGGNVYDDEVPDFSTQLQWAAGIGARYFTGFGPLRLDFGFPLNPREGIDDPVQFYISIGQAF
jgi:translocation and assembly module TamA